MPQQTLLVTDEFGVEVLVTSKSPANKAVLHLKAHGYRWIILPRRYYIKQDLTIDPEYGKIVIFAKAPFEASLDDTLTLMDERLRECLYQVVKLTGI